MDEPEDFPTKVVVCTNDACANAGVMIQVRDHAGLVICGVCGTVLQEPVNG